MSRSIIRNDMSKPSINSVISEEFDRALAEPLRDLSPVEEEEGEEFTPSLPAGKAQAPSDWTTWMAGFLKSVRKASLVALVFAVLSLPAVLGLLEQALEKVGGGGVDSFAGIAVRSLLFMLAYMVLELGVGGAAK